MDVLLLGCGHFKTRKFRFSNERDDFRDDNLITIDMNPDVKPDIVMDLNCVIKGEKLPFDDYSFDEIHAYDFLEHIGTFGDWRGFFTEFGEYHRILRNNGRMYIVVPMNEDMIADVGHTRYFHMNHFACLSQKFYELNYAQKTSFTDYRWVWKKNFDIVYFKEIIENGKNHHLAVILKKTEVLDDRASD